MFAKLVIEIFKHWQTALVLVKLPHKTPAVELNVLGEAAVALLHELEQLGVKFVYIYVLIVLNGPDEFASSVALN